MKYSALILFCFLPLFICDGVRVAINEKFIDAVLRNFYPEIKKYASGTKLPDAGKIDNLNFSIPNFNLNGIKISFTNQGLLNIRLQGLEPKLSGTVHYKIMWLIKSKNNFVVTLRNFYLNANFRIGTKYQNGVYVPDIQFSGDPDISFKFRLSLDGFLGGVVAKILELAGNFAKRFIMPAIKKQLRNMLEKVISGLPKEIPIGEYMLDVTLPNSNSIQLKNKFLEITSKARLFNPKISETKTKTFRTVYFPYLNSLGSQLQLYVSEYSVNSAIYTLLKTKGREITSTVSPSIVNMILPGFSDKYKDARTQIILNGSPEASIEITEQSMNVKLPGTFRVKVDGINKPVFYCNLDLSLKVEVHIKNGQKVSAKIHDLSAKVNTVYINDVSQANNSLIEQGFETVKETIIPLLNAFIQNYMEIPFPRVMGIRFTELNLQHKSHYLQINYNLVRY